MSSFTIVDNSLFPPVELAEGKERTTDPIHVRFLEGTFTNWVVRLDDFAVEDDRLTFGFQLATVPTEVTQEEVDQKSDELRQTVSNMVLTILEHYAQYLPE